jgi:hypothetical protein
MNLSWNKAGAGPFMFCLLLSCQAALTTSAEQTNEIYLFADNYLYVETEHGSYINPRKIAEAKTNRESLPAKDFPDGNWGELTNGIQLSLRFDKQAYTNGEKITAILLVRNTTNRLIHYRWIYPSKDYLWGDGPALLVTATDSGQPMPVSLPAKEAKQFTETFSSSELTDLFPHTQRKHMERLDDKYHLTAGTYRIHALVNVEIPKFVNDKPVRLDFTEIKSADVVIKIVSPPTHLR